MEKIKETIQNFHKGVVNETRARTGRIVYVHYDQLAEISAEEQCDSAAPSLAVNRFYH